MKCGQCPTNQSPLPPCCRQGTLAVSDSVGCRAYYELHLYFWVKSVWPNHPSIRCASVSCNLQLPGATTSMCGMLPAHACPSPERVTVCDFPPTCALLAGYLVPVRACVLLWVLSDRAGVTYTCVMDIFALAGQGRAVQCKPPSSSCVAMTPHKPLCASQSLLLDCM